MCALHSLNIVWCWVGVRSHYQHEDRVVFYMVFREDKEKEKKKMIMDTLDM